MTLTKTATGWIAQDQLMSYATPGVEQLSYGVDLWTRAADLAGLNWEPTTRRLYDVLTDTHVPGVHGVWNDRTFLGIATEKHKLISHKGLGEVVSTIQDVHDAPITAVVVLDGGRRVGVRVTHGLAEVPFDASPIERETWAWLRHDAKGSLSIIENAQRLFCTNQLGMLSGMEAALRVRHTGDVAAKTADLIEKLRAREDDWKLWEQEMASLQQTPVSDAAFDRFTRLYIPEPIPPVSATRAHDAQERLMGTWLGYTPDLGNNAYAGFQAITEFEDKLRASRGAVSRFQRAIQPNPNKDRGLRMLVEVAR